MTTLKKEKVDQQNLDSLARLAGNLANEFNNILSAIKGYVASLSIQLSQSGPLIKQLEAINKIIEYGESLTNQLQFFGHDTASGATTVDLLKIYYSLKDFLLHLWNSSITIQEEIDEDVEMIFGDKGEIRQVFLNLLLNAKEALPEGGLIGVKMKNVVLNQKEEERLGLQSKTKQYVLLQISDNGVGLTEEQKRHIFEPFFTTKFKEGKKGLGLSVVYGIVKKMQGNIIVESTKNQGTTFSLYFPVAEMAQKLEPNSDMQIKGGQETILIVEDVPEVQLLLIELLQSVGYKVVGASNFQEAFDYYQKHAKKIDLIISDVVLPDFYGTELIQKIQETRPDLKYILISGYAEQLDIEKDKNLFRGHFLQKPFQPSILLQMVRQQLDNK